MISFMTVIAVMPMDRWRILTGVLSIPSTSFANLLTVCLLIWQFLFWLKNTTDLKMSTSRHVDRFDLFQHVVGL
jgi:hypothetical protein